MKYQYYFLAVLFSFLSILFLKDIENEWQSAFYSVLSIVSIIIAFILEKKRK